ncbi:MAG: histidine kinase [Maribacter sp.]
MLRIFQNKSIRKFGFRFLVVLVIFFGVKLTINHGEEEALFNPASLFYFSSALFLTLFTWEINDFLIKRQLKTRTGLDFQNSLKILAMTMVFLVPVSAFVYYLGIYELDHICQINAADKGLQFRVDWIRALLLGLTIIVFNSFYFATKQKKDLELKMDQLQKEIMTSKYKSLKSQISPHFLFNSLNTLTSLMYEDRDIASDFVTRLASSYRYILDNKEADVVSLEKELGFLDSFIFMMNVRHTDSIRIETKIGVGASDYSIPTLSLQMLVENAMKHNYFSNEKPMHIKVYTVGKIALVVENTLRKRELKEESTQLGIKNIQKRYSFYTNQQVTVESDDSCFRVTMPLLDRSVLESPVLTVSG